MKARFVRGVVTLSSDLPLCDFEILLDHAMPPEVREEVARLFYSTTCLFEFEFAHANRFLRHCLFSTDILPYRYIQFLRINIDVSNLNPSLLNALIPTIKEMRKLRELVLVLSAMPHPIDLALLDLTVQELHDRQVRVLMVVVPANQSLLMSDRTFKRYRWAVTFLFDSRDGGHYSDLPAKPLGWMDNGNY
jgi:hypothetical protein